MNLLENYSKGRESMEDKEKILEVIQQKNLIRVINDSTWEKFVNSVNQEMPFPPAFIIKYITQPFNAKINNPAIENENFVADVRYFGDWKGESFPTKDYYSTIEWIKVRPRYLKYRGRLISPEVIDASNEFESILINHKISFEIDNGKYCIYAYIKEDSQ